MNKIGITPVRIPGVHTSDATSPNPPRPSRPIVGVQKDATSPNPPRPTVPQIKK